MDKFWTESKFWSRSSGQFLHGQSLKYTHYCLSHVVDLHILQADCQLEVQLFKLYHNEQGINNLTNELKAKSRDLDRLEKRKGEVEQELKTKKQENAKLSREMAAVEKKLASKVQPLEHKPK